jgi:hypothetical protein
MCMLNNDLSRLRRCRRKLGLTLLSKTLACTEVTVLRLQEATAAQVLDRSKEIGSYFLDVIQKI